MFSRIGTNDEHVLPINTIAIHNRRRAAEAYQNSELFEKCEKRGCAMGKWIAVGIVAVLVAAHYRADAERTITCDELAQTLGDNVEANNTWNKDCAKQTD